MFVPERGAFSEPRADVTDGDVGDSLFSPHPHTAAADTAITANPVSALGRM
jgi:hypothetical protein